MLVAAYGGLPIDFRTDPPTISFTDPATVDAIRQVLDLAKQGYLKYDAVGNLMGGAMFGAGLTAPIYTDTLGLFSLRRMMNTSQTDPYKPTVYPKGSQYAAASFNISTAYISAKSRNPEACYRWISTLATHTELLSALPARRSLLSALAQTQGPDVVTLFNETDKLLQDPNTVVFASQFASGTSPTGYLIQHWLYQAFDQYVLQDKDLESALKDAEGIAKGFQACTVNLPPLDTSDTEKARDYIKQFGDCAVKVDPSLKALFDLIPK
jgi:ABC-type glycerol-3-phosphate transport system substrate-binding protein